MMTRRIVKSAIVCSVAAALCAPSLMAGESYSTSAATGKAMAPPPVVEEDSFPLYGSVAFGYETNYMFRGVNYGDNAPWGGADFNYDLSDTMSLNVGVWYINPTSNPSDFDELDVYGFLNFPIGDLSVSVGMTAFWFPEAGGSTQEYGLSVSYPIGGLFDLGGAWWADANADDGSFGHYFEVNASKSIDLNDWIALNFGTGVGFGANYYGVSGGNHVFVTGGLSFALTDTMSLDTYIGGNFPIGDLSDLGEDDRVHGGVSVSVAF